jgi:hypothetical protein
MESLNKKAKTDKFIFSQPNFKITFNISIQYLDEVFKSRNIEGFIFEKNNVENNEGFIFEKNNVENNEGFIFEKNNVENNEGFGSSGNNEGFESSGNNESFNFENNNDEGFNFNSNNDEGFNFNSNNDEGFNFNSNNDEGFGNFDNHYINTTYFPKIYNRFQYVGDWGIYKGIIHHWVNRENRRSSYRVNTVNKYP